MDSISSLSPPATMHSTLSTGPAPHGSPAEVGRQFESMFTSLLIKQLRQTMDGESMFGNDPGDVVGGMFDHFLGDHIAKSGSLGIAQMIRAQLERRAAHL